MYFVFCSVSMCLPNLGMRGGELLIILGQVPVFSKAHADETCCLLVEGFVIYTGICNKVEGLALASLEDSCATRFQGTLHGLEQGLAIAVLLGHWLVEVCIVSQELRRSRGLG